jgi:hypothetical protein
MFDPPKNHENNSYSNTISELGKIINNITIKDSANEPEPFLESQMKI